MIDKSIFKEKKISLAIFRVIIGCVILVDIISITAYNSDIYNAKDFIYPSDNGLAIIEFLRKHIQYFLVAYIFVLASWIIGIGKNITSLLVYICVVLEFFLIQPYALWGDDILRATLLFFIFVDSFYYLSIKPIKSKSTIFSRWAVYAIMVHLCYIYVSNAYFKIQNDEWQSGFAVAYFLESAAEVDLFNIKELFINSSFLIKTSTWLVLIFQIIFPFLVWFKRIRIPLLIFGIITHFFMGFVLQAYKFEMIVMLHFAFFISDEEWSYMFKKLKIPIFVAK